MTQMIWRDGAWQPAHDTPAMSARDGAWLFGDSLFETLLVRQGRALGLKEHLDRLELSARLLGMGFDRRRCEHDLTAAAELLPCAVARLRLTLSRGNFSGLAFPEPVLSRWVLTAAPYREPSAAERHRGWTCRLAPNRRVNPLSHLPQLKRGNYADCLYAWNHARAGGADEALFVSAEGALLEGATSNLFVVRDGILKTPPAGELVLAGVVRGLLLQAAAGTGLRCEETQLVLADLAAADEAFLTNSLILLMPLASFEGSPLSRGRVWSRLLAELENRLT